MKKLLVGVMILALVVIASSAMAAGPKPPKNLCLDFSSWGDYHQLLFKNMGSIPTANGPTKMYSVSGHAYNGYHGPVQGSAYMVSPGTIIHGSYDFKYGTSSHLFGSYELYFDVSTGTGTIYFRYNYPDGSLLRADSDTVTSTDCTALTIPSAMNVDGTDVNPGGSASSIIR